MNEARAYPLLPGVLLAEVGQGGPRRRCSMRASSRPVYELEQRLRLVHRLCFAIKSVATCAHLHWPRGLFAYENPKKRLILALPYLAKAPVVAFKAVLSFFLDVKTGYSLIWTGASSYQINSIPGEQGAHLLTGQIHAPVLVCRIHAIDCKAFLARSILMVIIAVNCLPR